MDLGGTCERGARAIVSRYSVKEKKKGFLRRVHSAVASYD